MIKREHQRLQGAPASPAQLPVLSGSDRELKDSIISRYKPSPSFCGGAVSLFKGSPYAGTTRFDVACLIQGSRVIVWATLQGLKKELNNDSEYAAFERVIKSENIKELDRVLYRPEGKRNALLFIKAMNQPLLVNNSYLVGTLLGYNPDDIEFYYQRHAFRPYLFKKRNIEWKYAVAGSYEEFFPELKEEFDAYKAHIWPKFERLRSYELDKMNALQWLKENYKFTNDQLYQQIEELKNWRR